MLNYLNKVWVGLDTSGCVVNGGHNRKRVYFKSKEIAIKWGSGDRRVVKIVEFDRRKTVWERNAPKE